MSLKMKLKSDAEAIFQAGLSRVHSRFLIEQVLKLDGEILTVKTETEEFKVDLSLFKKIKLIGFGKASAQMAAGLCAVLGERILIGLIVVKDSTTAKLPSCIEVLVGAHPVPNEKSFIAGKRILEFCQACADDELVLGLISGGASTLMEHPLEGLNHDDFLITTQKLLTCGATIHEMNCIRKHLSAIKGGRLACAIFPAASLNFILSDVVGDDLSVIASGPTISDPSTFEEAWKIVEKYQLNDVLPLNVVKVLGIGSKMQETPKLGEERLGRTKNILVGTNRQALIAAKNKAQALGYETIILSDELQGEAHLVAKKLHMFSREVAKGQMMKLPACILAGGETTVTVKGTGKGGRNQEMALSFLSELQKSKAPHEAQIFLSASTDGGDGPTNAAGAFASVDILKRAHEAKLNIDNFLNENDSYHFFERVDGLFKTGPTETNVCDLQILLIKKGPL
jgi:glycerate 2-kinase